MSVYVITGTSRGIGFEFLKQFSEDPKNLVVGLVRDKSGAEKKVKQQLGDRANVHILHGDLTDYASLKQAAADTADIVGERGVDYLLASAAFTTLFDQFDPIGKLQVLSLPVAEQVEEIDRVSAELYQINATGNIHLFKLFLPLVMKSKTKKVIAITSGHADLDLINDLDIDVAALYSASKAALNVIVAKFSAQYKKDGVLFMSLSPGVVEVGHYDNVPPEKLQSAAGFMEKMTKYAPHFKGPVSPSEAVTVIRSTLEKVSIETGYAGAFVSHLGTKQWV